jgi:AcrR family transcriptional regulator
MARTVNVAVRTVRREAFVDVAERLIQAKGYEQMSVQDVLDELDASRGAFYHYFDSKQALLEAVIDRMVDVGLASLAPVIDDPKLSAIQKLDGLFGGIARWKSARKDLLVAITKVWVSDDNALVREKLRRTTAQRVVPLLSAIIKEGVDDGLFASASPDHTASVLVAMMEGARDTAVELFLARQANTVTFESVERSFAAYTEAFERILGVPAGSLTLTDAPTLRLWFG